MDCFVLAFDLGSASKGKVAQGDLFARGTLHSYLINCNVSWLATAINLVFNYDTSLKTCAI